MCNYENEELNINYNLDYEKENDILDSMKQGATCSGAYCQNCDFCSTCDKKPYGWWE